MRSARFVPLLPLLFLGPQGLVACGGKPTQCASPPCESAAGGTSGATGTGGDPGNASGGSENGSGGTGGLSFSCAAAPLTTAPASGLTLNTTPQGGVTHKVHINHVGYDVARAKRAVVEANGALTSFQIARSSDQSVVFESALKAVDGFTAMGGGPNFYLADFSTLREPGEYFLQVNGASSPTFRIAANVLAEETLAAVISYFKNSRADDVAVWNADATVTRTGGGSSENVQGGWYDASGDISKYLSHLSYANYLNPQQIPLVAWALAFAKDEGGQLLSATNQTAAAEAEALYGADYLVRVLDDAGYFYTTVFDGWTGTLSARSICAFEGEAGTKTAEYQAAFREGGGLAVAALARIAKWGKAGAFSSAEYLAAAKKGFSHLETNGSTYTDDGKENIIDDYAALLAAAELFASTSEAMYLTRAGERAASLEERLSEAGYFIADGGTRPFWHGSDPGLPVLALLRYASLETDDTKRTAALATVKAHLDYLEKVSSEVSNPYGYARQHFRTGGTVKSGFFMPHDNESGYWWQGENARLGSIASALLLGESALADEAGCENLREPTLSLAQSQLDWILGSNPYDVSFLKGAGRNNPPAYCGEKAPYHGTLSGGIANGITGANVDGTGIAWLSGAPIDECWRDWRWSEQWLPHSAWFLIALVAEAKAN